MKLFESLPAKASRLVLSVVFTLCLSHAHRALGLIDTNADGMSDIWQLDYPQTLGLPQADPDVDVRTNLEESWDGTDPGDSNSVFRLTSLIRSNNASHVAWSTARGKRYQLYETASLADWTPVGSQQVASTSSLSAVSATGGDAHYYQASLYEVLNSDTDSLTDLEEERVGTDPLNWDTDSDKVADDVELMIGTDPNATTDTDTDGLPDDFERWIIHVAQTDSDPGNDSINSLATVLPGDDFDGDSLNNLAERTLGTSPVLAIRNILFLLSEDQSYHLGSLGTVGLDTPKLDNLGTNGVMFDRAFCLAPVCSPAKMSLFTGTYPHQNSAERNVPNYGVSFPLVGDPSNTSLGGVHEDLPTLIEILSDRGFFTAISSKTHVQPIRKFPFDKGYSNPGTPTAATNIMNDMLVQAGDRPFFMVFNIGSPHLPFRNVPNANGVWSGTGGLTGDGHVTNVDANAIEVPSCYPDVPGVRQDIADYYGAIEVVDSIFGAAIDVLSASNHLSDTLIVFTGDHGIGLHRAKQSIYSAGMHVPLLIDGPGVAAGVRIDHPVSMVDLVPTFLDWQEIPEMPSMVGRSLWPLLSGATKAFPDRPTVLAAANDKYDARAVCDGRYYYIQNLRKIQGSTLRLPVLNGSGIDPLLDIALNTDQYKAGSPWFNRAFEATVNATGTIQRELLRQMVEGDVPDEELYDMDTDLWMTNNLINEPAHAALIETLRAELGRWRVLTEDIVTNSPAQLVRRTIRDGIVPGGPAPTNPPSAFTNLVASFTDNFNGKSGNLDADPDWTTRIFGNAGADFVLGSGYLDAPPGPQPPAATADPISQTNGQGFILSADITFPSDAVWNGVVFGFQDANNFYTFELQDTLDIGQGSPGTRQVVRMRCRQGGSFSTLISATQGTLSDPVRNQAHRLTVSCPPGGSTFTLTLSNMVSVSLLWSNSVTDTTFTSGNFGVISDTSGSGRYDDFVAEVYEP